MSKVKLGERLAAVAAVLLLVVMFQRWFGVDGKDRLDHTAWQAFTFIDVLLLLTILVAIGQAVMAWTSRSTNLPVAASALTAGLGILMTALVLLRLIFTPDDLDPSFFAFVGLVLTGAIAWGGWMAMQEEGVSFKSEIARAEAEASKPKPKRERKPSRDPKPKRERKPKREPRASTPKSDS